jgi:hypothetical protein
MRAEGIAPPEPQAYPTVLEVAAERGAFSDSRGLR